MSLGGKTAVVTGGGRGIGLTYCERHAADDANVAIIDKDDATPVLATPPCRGEKLALMCDVGEPAQTESCAAVVLSRFRRCDTFVDNAAFVTPFSANLRQ